AQDKDKNTALHLACLNENEIIVKDLVEHDANVNEKNNYGYTPLHYSCKNGNKNIENNKSIVEYLIENGGDVNILDNEKNTPLHIACKNNNETIVKYLVD
ncbi:hypothetical protein PIROE2DRAFT_27621, partial [Piromyces sp. E2]